MGIIKCVLRDITLEMVFGAERNSHLKETGMFVISLRGINFRYLVSTSARIVWFKSII